MYLFLVKMFALVWHARAARHDLPLLSCKYSHPLGNSGWRLLHGGKRHDPNCHNMLDALQHARCQIHKGIYNCNLFIFEKHPAVQSLTCGKVLATNLSSQWICLNFLSVSSSLFFTGQVTTRPFPLLTLKRVLFEYVLRFFLACWQIIIVISWFNCQCLPWNADSRNEPSLH